MKELGFKIKDEVITVTTPCYCSRRKTEAGETFTKGQMKKGIFVRHPEEVRLIRIRIVKDDEGKMEMIENVRLPSIMSILPICVLSLITDKVVDIFRISSSSIGPFQRTCWTLRWDYTQGEYQRENPIPSGNYGIGD